MSVLKNRLDDKGLAALKDYAFHCRWRAYVTAVPVLLVALAMVGFVAFGSNSITDNFFYPLAFALVVLSIGLRWGSGRFQRVIEAMRREKAAPKAIGRILWFLPIAALIFLQIWVLLDMLSDASFRMFGNLMVISLFFLLPLGRFIALAWLLPRFIRAEGFRKGSASPGKVQRPSGFRAHPARGVWHSFGQEATPRRIRALEKGCSIRSALSPLLFILPIGLIIGIILPHGLQVLNHRPTQAYASAPRSNFWKWMRKSYVDTHQVRGNLWGPVASLRIQKELVRNKSWGSEKFTETIYVGPLGRVFSSAGKPYSLGVDGSRTEVSLSIKKLKQGSVALSVEKLSSGGRPLNLQYQMDCILETTGEGWVSLPISTGSLSVRLLDVDFTLYEPRKVTSWRLPAGINSLSVGENRWRIHGKLARLATDTVPIFLRWQVQNHLRPALGNNTIDARTYRLGDRAYLSVIAPSPCGADLSSIYLLGLDKPAKNLGDLHPRLTGGRRAPKQSVLRKSNIIDLPCPTSVVNGLFGVFGKWGEEKMAPSVPVRFSAMNRLIPEEVPTRTYAGLGVMIAFLTPGFRHARSRASARACFANQKTLAGAIEMYNLDYNTDWFSQTATSKKAYFKAPDRFQAANPNKVLVGAWQKHRRQKEATSQLVSLAQILPILKKQGYLQNIPRDPGGGNNSSHHYVAVKGEICCLRHGFIQPPGGISTNSEIPRQFLLKGACCSSTLRGITEAARKKARIYGNHAPLAILDLQLVLALPILLPIWKLGRWRGWIRMFVSGSVCLYLGLLIGSVIRPLPETVAVNAVVYSVLLFSIFSALLWRSISLLRSNKVLDGLFGSSSSVKATTGSRESVLAADGIEKEASWYHRIGRISLALSGFSFLALVVISLGAGKGVVGTPGYPWMMPLAIGIVVLFAIALVAPGIATLVVRLATTKSYQRRIWHVGGLLLLAVPILLGIGNSMTRYSRISLLSTLNMQLLSLFTLGLGLRWFLLGKLTFRIIPEASRLVDGEAVEVSVSTGPEGDTGLAGVTMTQTAVCLGDALCPVCAESFTEGNRVVFCSDCATPHHEDCWDFNDGCAVFACTSASHSTPVPVSHVS